MWASLLRWIPRSSDTGRQARATHAPVDPPFTCVCQRMMHRYRTLEGLAPEIYDDQRERDLLSVLDLQFPERMMPCSLPGHTHGLPSNGDPLIFHCKTICGYCISSRGGLAGQISPSIVPLKSPEQSCWDSAEARLWRRWLAVRLQSLMGAQSVLRFSSTNRKRHPAAIVACSNKQPQAPTLKAPQKLAYNPTISFASLYLHLLPLQPRQYPSRHLATL